MSQMRAVFVSSRFFFDKENGIDGLIQFLGRAPPLSLNVDFCEGYSHFRLEMIWKRLKFSERAPQPVYYGSRFFGPGWAKKTSWIKTFHFCTGLVQKSSFFAVFCILFIEFYFIFLLENWHNFSAAPLLSLSMLICAGGILNFDQKWYENAWNF